MQLDWRTVDLARRHFSGVAYRVWRILQTLFHEVMGVLFLAMAAWGVIWMLREWREFRGDGDALFKLLLVGVFVLMMSSFGISSFWRARRISRGK